MVILTKRNKVSGVTEEKDEGPAETKLKAQTGKTWGRDRDITYFTVFFSAIIMIFCPIIVTVFWLTCTHYQCSLYEPIHLIQMNGFSKEAFNEYIVQKLPSFSLEALEIYFGWLIFQGMLYEYLPSMIGYGQQTPAGHVLPYKVNGLLAWFITHLIFILGAFYFGLWDASIIHDKWEGLFVAANIYGFFLTFFAYIKAQISPSHPEDRKFSGSFVYDLLMGVEMNPRFGKYWDFKLFHNGRPGIIAWTLINFSFAAAQYNKIGYVTNSMILLNFLHAIYVLDFFYNEDWYLRTIDIAHEHFGFYLAWGDTVWLPWMYTIQSHYLVRNPIDLSWVNFSIVLSIGLAGYYIFRAANNQKDMVRKANGNCNVWGKPAKFIKTQYLTSDGKIHSSILLVSGFWGISRHFNYVGDLLISLAMCLTCGFNHLLPYFYIIYMTILLVHRIWRDDARCKGKYGKYWDEYGKIVRWKLIPYVY